MTRMFRMGDEVTIGVGDAMFSGSRRIDGSRGVIVGDSPWADGCYLIESDGRLFNLYPHEFSPLDGGVRE